MIFIKVQLNDDVELKIDLYGDEFRSYCPMCHMEHDVDIESIAKIIMDGNDLASTQVACIPCTKKVRDNHEKPRG